MKRTFTLPNGEKVRTATVRDYVYIVQGRSGAYVERRSDNRQLLLDMIRKHQLNASIPLYLGNTVTGELVPYYPREQQ